MKKRTNYKRPLAACVLLLATSPFSLVQAEAYPYSNQGAQPGYNPGYQNYPATQGYAGQGYGAPGYAAPGYAQPYYGRRGYDRDSSFSPWGGDSPSFSGPWGGDRGSSMPWNSRRGGSGPSFSGPWDGGRGNSMPWGGRRGGNSMPWSGNRGGNSMPWDSGRGGWMDKNRFADSWDDMLNAPSDMGEMPGGIKAPSVSVPNPVDVGDQFDDAARDVPDQMRNVYDDNRRNR